MFGSLMERHVRTAADGNVPSKPRLRIEAPDLNRAGEPALKIRDERPPRISMGRRWPHVEFPNLRRTAGTGDVPLVDRGRDRHGPPGLRADDQAR